MGVWHRYSPVSCDCDIMWVSIPKQSALFFYPPLILLLVVLQLHITHWPLAILHKAQGGRGLHTGHGEPGTKAPWGNRRQSFGGRGGKISYPRSSSIKNGAISVWCRSGCLAAPSGANEKIDGSNTDRAFFSHAPPCESEASRGWGAALCFM